MAENDDDFERGQFTERERQRLRRMMRDDDRADWLKGAIKVWIYTIGAVATAAIATATAYSTFMKWIRP